VWIGLGLILSVGVFPFLLLGVPLLVLFQLVRRQPLRTLCVVVTSWMLTPNLATARNGDPVVLAHLEEQNSMGMLNGSTTSPSPRSTWTRRIQCSWPALVLQPRHRWRSGR
jgi:hypothetical protein